MWASLIWGGVAAALAYARVDSALLASLFGAGIGLAMAFISHRTHREFLAWAPTHRLVVRDDALHVIDGAAESSLPYTAISKLIVNRGRSGPKSLVLTRENGVREHMPAYGNLAELTALLREKLEPSCIEDRRFVHV
jgi:hypothetical protein